MKILTPAGQFVRLRAASPLLVAAGLAACGGGSGGAGTNEPPPPPPPAMAGLTLTGTVTDEPIANAEVTVTVGDETFTTTADANGNYTIEIEIEEADADAFVTLTARGVNEQDFVTFASLAGSFAALTEQAGDDETLSSEEDFSVQITNVTTAEAALLQEANGGEPITNDEDLRTLGTAINAQDVLDLATAIKLAVDSSESYPLPDGVTIMDIVSDPAEWPQFVQDVQTQDPEAFTAARTAIAQDPALTQPVDVADIPESLVAATLSTDAGFTFNLTNRVSAFTFNEDGTGFASGGTFDQAMTWTIEGSSVEVLYTTPVETFSYPTEECDGTVRQVYASFVSAGVSLTLLSDRTLAITETSDVTYLDCASLQPREMTDTLARTILDDDDFLVQSMADLADSAQTIYVYDETQGIDPVVADIADINADGTGSTRLLGKTFTWSLDETALEAIAEFADGTVGRYRTLRRFDELGSDIVFELKTAAGDRYVDANVSVDLDPGYLLEFTQENVVGSHYQFGYGEETVDDARLVGFYLRLDQGGTGAQVYDYVDFDGNVVLVDESVDAGAALRWAVEPDGLVLRRTVGQCIHTEPGCVMYDVRRMVPLGSFEIADGSRSYVLEKRHFDSEGVDAGTPATFLVRFYDTHEETAAVSTKLTTPRRTVMTSPPGALRR